MLHSVATNERNFELYPKKPETIKGRDDMIAVINHEERTEKSKKIEMEKATKGTQWRGIVSTQTYFDR